jgi:hypothetical protein
MLRKTPTPTSPSSSLRKRSTRSFISSRGSLEGGEHGDPLVLSVDDATIASELYFAIALNYKGKSPPTVVSGELRQANEEAGGPVLFHPEAVGTLQRMQTAEALEALAGEDWLYSDRSELPKDWATRVSTFLKAFACGLNPSCLQQMGELLVQAGYKTEAREAFEVVLLFPTYASTYYGGAPGCEDIVAKTVNRARDSLGKLQDLPKTPGTEKPEFRSWRGFHGEFCRFLRSSCRLGM